MKISALKIGLVVVIIGMAWVSVILNETEKNHEEIVLKKSNSIESKLELTGKNEIGYYKIYMPEFDKEKKVFVQILDTNLNVIKEQKINTKFLVSYFDFDKDGTYTIKVSNISENQVNVQIEFGDTNSQEMVVPGVMILLGSLLIMLISYLKIKNYKIEQPDENITWIWIHCIVWPKVKTKLKSNQVTKNKNAIMEKGRNNFNLVCSLFFIIKTAPKDARIKPNSSGWWDKETNPSIPNISWDNESPNPETIWMIDPAITSLIPVFRDPWTDFLSNNKQPIAAAKVVIKTPV